MTFWRILLRIPWHILLIAAALVVVGLPDALDVAPVAERAWAAPPRAQYRLRSIALAR